MDGYIDQRYSCDPRVLDTAILDNTENVSPPIIEAVVVEENECVFDSDCTDIENAICSINGQCQCQEGFLPTYDDNEPLKLTWCKDPIVLTSTVGGYCLISRYIFT